ncbi:MAG: PQQ-dependent sugar dehydrogenase [Candidatus Blackburnbacteria bacterium]|nr:PQQ-dependent sugar dehydrogenase [Candidatus Blackburnbacteria bacterium]
MKKILVGVLILIFIAGGISFLRNRQANQTLGTQPLSQNTSNGTPLVVVQDLNIPWEVAFLPSGEMLVTERPGNLVQIGKDKSEIVVQGVKHVGEGGLLGMALHPKFNENRLVYLYSTTQGGGTYFNRVERYKLEEGQLLERKKVVSGIRGSANHDGGRIIFGPDGMLYIGTGDAESPILAQDTNSLNGKILRVRDDGSIPEDNPFGNAVWAFGFRNVQGLAFDDKGQLWATDHGPSGAQTGDDELNKVEKGKNYGWPAIRGDQTKEGMVTPVINSGRKTWAPSGMAFESGKLYFAGLAGQAVYTYNPQTGSLETKFENQFGRLRTVAIGKDEELYVLTSNTDGRGTPSSDDDKLIKIW